MIHLIQIGILEYGQDLVNSDPQKNLMFSIHSYGEKNQNTKIGNINWSNYDLLAWTIKFEKKLTFIFGEFGKCDYNTLMKYLNLFF